MALQPLRYREVEVNDVAAPVPAHGVDAVTPAVGVIGLLAIVEQVLGKVVGYLVLVSKCKKTCTSWADGAFAIARRGANVIEKVFVGICYPRALGLMTYSFFRTFENRIAA